MPCSKLEMLRARVGDVSRDAALVMPRVGDVSRVLRALEKGPFDVTFLPVPRVRFRLYSHSHSHSTRRRGDQVPEHRRPAYAVGRDGSVTIGEIPSRS